MGHSYSKCFLEVKNYKVTEQYKKSTRWKDRLEVHLYLFLEHGILSLWAEFPMWVKLKNITFYLPILFLWL